MRRSQSFHLALFAARADGPLSPQSSDRWAPDADRVGGGCGLSNTWLLPAELAQMHCRTLRACTPVLVVQLPPRPAAGKSARLWARHSRGITAPRNALRAAACRRGAGQPARDRRQETGLRFVGVPAPVLPDGVPWSWRQEGSTGAALPPYACPGPGTCPLRPGTREASVRAGGAGPAPSSPGFVTIPPSGCCGVCREVTLLVPSFGCSSGLNA